MKNLVLSNSDFYKDSDHIIQGIFSSEDFPHQPRYLVEVGTDNGVFLKHVYQYIHMHTARGKNLKEFPLDFIILVDDRKVVEALSFECLGLSFKIGLVKNYKAETILEALDGLGVVYPHLSLYLQSLTDHGNFISFEECSKIKCDYGFLFFQLHSLESDCACILESSIAKDLINSKGLDSAEDYLLAAANQGLFPRVNSSFFYSKSVSCNFATLNLFQKRDYRIRIAHPEDLDSLKQLEKLCWKKGMQKSGEVLSQRIQRYPKGQLVLETAQGIVGNVYSQKIKSIDDLYQSSSETIDRIIDLKGSVVNLIALNILPDKYHPRLEHGLLEFFLQKSSVINGVNKIATVVKCDNYPGSEVISMESYIEELKEDYGLADNITHFHVLHGAKIVNILGNYRPHDASNLGVGILMVYDRLNREPTFHNSKDQKILSIEKELSPELIGLTFDEVIQRFAASHYAFVYDRRIPFADLGLKPIRLLEIRALLSREFNVDLSADFFETYRTGNEAIEYLVDIKLHRFKEWFYGIDWQSSPKTPTGLLAVSGVWLVFAEENEEIAPLITKDLEESGHQVVKVISGEVFKQFNEHSFAINPVALEDMKKLLALLSLNKEGSGIIFLWGLKTLEEDKTVSCEDLMSFHQKSMKALTNLMQALVHQNIATPLKIWAVTRSLITDGSLQGLFEWPLHGLAKIIREEFPEFELSYIAIDPLDQPEENVKNIICELSSGSPEWQVAYRGGERLVPRWHRQDLKGLRIPRFTSKSSYLFVGALYPKGLQVAQWYLDHGAENLIFLDEGEADAKTLQAFAQFEKKGANIFRFSTKLHDHQEMEQIFERIKRECRPLSGVVQIVPPLDESLLIHMNWEQFKEVERLVVAASWNVHLMTQNLTLDHFILFSSCLPDLAPFNQSPKASGYSFLDMLSYYRHGLSLPALSVKWGEWVDAPEEFQWKSNQLKRVEPIHSEEGLQVLEKIFYFNKPQIIAAKIHWPFLLQNLKDHSVFFDDLKIEYGFKKAGLLKTFLLSTKKERPLLLQNYLKEQLEQFIPGPIDVNAQFSLLGIDKRAMTLLIDELQADYDHIFQITPPIFEQHPTVKQLSKALSEMIVIKFASIIEANEEKPILSIFSKAGQIISKTSEEPSQVEVLEINSGNMEEINKRIKLIPGKKSFVVFFSVK